MRTAIGVIAGYIFFALGAVVIFAVSGRDPHASAELGFMIASTIGGMVSALIAGLMASAIARRRDGRPALILAGLIALVALISMFTMRAGGDRWTTIATLLFMAPCAVVGGIIYDRLHHVRTV